MRDARAGRRALDPFRSAPKTERPWGDTGQRCARGHRFRTGRDDQLTIERVENGREAQLRALQRERARMIDSLAQVRYAEMLAAELP
jgi:hypothetical protein